MKYRLCRSGSGDQRHSVQIREFPVAPDELTEPGWKVGLLDGCPRSREAQIGDRKPRSSGRQTTEEGSTFHRSASEELEHAIPRAIDM